MARMQTYEERRAGEELRPLFLAAMGFDTSIVRAAEHMGISHYVLTRWIGHEAGLALVHHDVVKKFIAEKPALCAQKRGAKRKGDK